MAKNPTAPKHIIDRNGKATTVHTKVDADITETHPRLVNLMQSKAVWDESGANHPAEFVDRLHKAVDSLALTMVGRYDTAEVRRLANKISAVSEANEFWTNGVVPNHPELSIALDGFIRSMRLKIATTSNELEPGKVEGYELALSYAYDLEKMTKDDQTLTTSFRTRDITANEKRDIANNLGVSGIMEKATGISSMVPGSNIVEVNADSVHYVAAQIIRKRGIEAPADSKLLGLAKEILWTDSKNTTFRQFAQDDHLYSLRVGDLRDFFYEVAVIPEV